MVLMEKIIAKYGGGPLIKIGQVNLVLVLRAGLLLGNRDSELLSQSADGFGKTNAILAHEELENTSSSSTAKTFEDAFGGADTEGGGFFVVEGAQAEEVCSGSF